jgi:pSer/pThr/pTyr-binding forkhead associated (FHA) protein
MTIKKEFIYFAIIEQSNDAKLAYQINPKLTLGLDPRNDVVLVDKNIEERHLEFRESDGQISVTQLANTGTTTINGKPLEQNNQYLIGVHDQLKVGQIRIRFKKDLGFKNREIIEQKKEVQTQNRPKVVLAEKGFNFHHENQDVLTENQTIIKDSKQHIHKDSTLLKVKQLNLDIKWDFVTKFFLGLIFDFFFAYFLLSLFPDIKLHLYLFFGIIEILLMFIFKSTAGQFLFKHRFNRQFTTWVLLFLFLIYPLSKGSFSVPFKQINIIVNNVIDIHAKKYMSFSKNNSLGLNTEIDNDSLVWMDANNGIFNLNFMNLKSKEILKLQHVESFDTIKFNKYIYRTHPFKLPVKIKYDSLLEKKYLIKILSIDRSNIKQIFLENGPFLSFINDTKSLFLDGLNGDIESVQFVEDCPVLFFRDKTIAKVYFIGDDKIIQFIYKRPKSIELENLFIEKILAKTRGNLVHSTENKIGFLEMFDAFPEVDFDKLVESYIQNKDWLSSVSQDEKVRDELINSINRLQIEIIKAARNTGPKLIKQLDELKDNLETNL